MSSYGYTNQGLCESEKPTSRVLRPPGGGGSLNIFGGGGDPSPAKSKPQPVKQTPPPPVAKQPVKQTPPLPVKQTPPPPVAKQPVSTIINPSPSSAATERTTPAKRTSTKVHAPPGGKSSFSFY
ncbi:uncharacterized protein LOC135349799 [Halichondria panicea]|uniref:uncharacterized protein LOC135349799 n=1 Tax=Halichondria panicea TaxID=6063 RepID=UPI00312B9A8B